MKKLAVLMLAALLLPIAADANITKEGDPAFYVNFPATTQEVIRGSVWSYRLGPANFGFVSGTCTDADTFCIEVTDELGWTITGNPELDEQHILDPGYLWWQWVYVEIPCDADVGDTNWVHAIMAFGDGTVCYPDSGDCEDPNFYGSNRWQNGYVKLQIVETPPALYILQDTLYYVEQGQTAAYIPFSICNGDPCAPPTTYNYTITSVGHVGGPISVTDAITANGGECEDVYGVIDAGAADVCDYDTLTIIAWDDATGLIYDTCVQAIHVVTPLPVPLFTAPVVTILVLAMILAAAVIMKRHAVSKA